MKLIRLAVLVVVLAASACGGAGSPNEEADPGEGSGTAGGEQSSSSDGTQLFTVSVSGIDIVDLEDETQEPFVEGLEQPHALTVAGDNLLFGTGDPALVMVDVDSGDEIGRVQLPATVTSLVVDGNTAWVLAGVPGLDEQLVSVDLDDMTLRGGAVPPENSRYWLVAAEGDNVWVFGGDLELLTTVRPVDAASVSVGDPIDTGLIGESMIIAGGNLWVGGAIIGTSDSPPHSGLARMDPSTGEVLDVIDLSENDDHVTLGSAFGYLWATQALSAELIKLDAATGEEIDRVDTGDGAAGIPVEILVTEDLIWTFNNNADEALGRDPETLELESGIDVPPFAPAPVFAP